MYPFDVVHLNTSDSSRFCVFELRPIQNVCLRVGVARQRRSVPGGAVPPARPHVHNREEDEDAAHVWAHLQDRGSPRPGRPGHAVADSGTVGFRQIW